MLRGGGRTRSSFGCRAALARPHGRSPRVAVTTTQSSELGEESIVRKTWIVLAFALGLVAACGGSAATGTLQANGTPTGGTPTGTQSATTQPSTGATGATGSAAGSALSGPIACSLITAAEAAAALGDPVSPGVA